MRSCDESLDQTNPMEGSVPPSRPEMDVATERVAVVAAHLYPELSKKERRLAAENLLHYFEIALDVAEDRGRSGHGLTHPQSIPTMKERSNSHLKA